MAARTARRTCEVLEARLPQQLLHPPRRRRGCAVDVTVNFERDRAVFVAGQQHRLVD